MIKEENKVLDLYKHFTTTKKKDWEFGNSVCQLPIFVSYPFLGPV